QTAAHRQPSVPPDLPQESDYIEKRALSSPKANQIPQLYSKVASDFQVPHQQELFVNSKTRRGLPLAGSLVDLADIDIEPIEDVAALALLCSALLENLPVSLLHQQHGGAPGHHAIVAGQLFPGCAGGQQRNDFLLWQRRLAGKY